MKHFWRFWMTIRYQSKSDSCCSKLWSDSGFTWIYINGDLYFNRQLLFIAHNSGNFYGANIFLWSNYFSCGHFSAPLRCLTHFLMAKFIFWNFLKVIYNYRFFFVLASNEHELLNSFALIVIYNPTFNHLLLQQYSTPKMRIGFSSLCFISSFIWPFGWVIKLCLKLYLISYW